MYFLKTIFKPFLTIIIILFIVLSSCTIFKVRKDLQKYAAFDWFIYKGRDPVYLEPEKPEDMFYNPVLAGFYPDPSICRVDDDYYLITSSFSYFPGVPIFHSKDLANWEQIGHVLNRPSQLPLDSLGVSRGIFAPTISYYNGIFFMITTLVDGGGNFYVTAADPAGTWSDPVWLPEIDGIDPSFFFDEDGKTFILHNGPPPDNKSLYSGHRAIWMWEYDLDSNKITEGPILLVNGGTDISKEPVWIEGPHIYKTNGYYYLMAAEGGTAEDHSEVIFRSTSIKGSYVPYENNPILTQRHLDPDRTNPVTSTGHADMVELPNGEWWVVFLGCRPYEKDLYNTGRETFLLPVTWENGWPVILKNDEEVPFLLKKPKPEQSVKGNIPLNGNFTIKEEFNGKIIPINWNFLRTPRKKWFELEGGKLYMESRKETIFSISNPSFIARRQQHLHFSASVSLEYILADTLQTAGLVAFQNEKNYLLMGKRLMADGSIVVYLEKASVQINNGRPEILVHKPLVEDSGKLQLKINGTGRYYNFYYRYTNLGEWNILIENVDASMLSTKEAGGFVGTFLGMYASSNHFND